MARLGDVLHKGIVAVLATVSLVGGISVSLSMYERFAMHRQHRGEAAPEGGAAAAEQPAAAQQQQ